MLDNFLKYKPAKISAALGGGLFLILAAHSIHSFVGASAGAVASRERLFICSESGKSFTHEPKSGETLPIVSPFSKQNTAYPAELCYWTKDGGASDKPVAVLLKRYLGESGPTFCPDCGRLVVGHNPAPQLGMKPPPTQAEYARSHSAEESDDQITADAQR